MDNQPDLLSGITYPYRAGAKGGETSEQAAKDMQPRLGGLQQQVLHAIKRTGGLASFELIDYCQPSTYRSLQPRTSELARLGLIKATDETRTDPETGKRCRVWRVA